MTASYRLAWFAAIAAAALALPLVVMRPQIGLALVIVAIAVALAARSPAIPLAFSSAGTLPAVLLAGRLPQGATVASFGAWNLIALFIALVRSGRTRPLLRDSISIPIVATAALVGFMVLRLAGSPSPGYGSQKVQLTIVALGLPLALGLVVGRDSAEIKRFLRWFIVLESAAAVYALYQLRFGGLQTFAEGRFTVASDVNPIEIARDMGTLAVVLFFAITHTRSGVSRLAYALAAIPTFVTLLASGSRAPLVALVVATGVLLATRIRDPRLFRRMARIVIVLVAAGTVAILSLVPTSAVERAISAFGGDTVGAGEVTRTVLWHEAIQTAQSHLWFGIGTGGFASIEPHGLLYPHNIFLETFAELGLFALAVLVLAVGLGTARIAYVAFSNRPGASWAGLMTALLVFQIFNACFSGDLPNNSQIWVWLAIGLAQARRSRATR